MVLLNQQSYNNNRRLVTTGIALLVTKRACAKQALRSTVLDTILIFWPNHVCYKRNYKSKPVIPAVNKRSLNKRTDLNK